VIGRTYLLRGESVTVLQRWGAGGGPRNVLIQRADGSRVVRPFRGLRRVQAAETRGAPEKETGVSDSH
jgi:acetyl esterase